MSFMASRLLRDSAAWFVGGRLLDKSDGRELRRTKRVKARKRRAFPDWKLFFFSFIISFLFFFFLCFFCHIRNMYFEHDDLQLTYGTIICHEYEDDFLFCDDLTTISRSRSLDFAFSVFWN